MEILLAKTEQEKEKVFRLRYDIFFREFGKSLPGIDHSDCTIVQDPDDFADIFYADQDGEIVGSIRFLKLSDYPFDQFYKIDISDLKNQYYANEISNASLICLKKGYRGKGITELFSSYLYTWAKESGICYNVAIAPMRCLNYYRLFGYKLLGETVFCPDYDEPICLIAINLTDIPHLRGHESHFTKSNIEFTHAL
jgi:GNAT superfamily N-acetyltransferase